MVMPHHIFERRQKIQRRDNQLSVRRVAGPLDRHPSADGNTARMHLAAQTGWVGADLVEPRLRANVHGPGVCRCMVVSHEKQV